MFSRLTKSLGFLAIVLAATLAVPQFTFAQDDRDDDPPSRAARLSYTGGAVSFEPAGTDDCHCRRQPSDHHWRQAVDRPRRPRRAALQFYGRSPGQRNWFFVS